MEKNISSKESKVKYFLCLLSVAKRGRRELKWERKRNTFAFYNFVSYSSFSSLKIGFGPNSTPKGTSRGRELPNV